MASIIIFGTIWGFTFKEWAQSRPRTKAHVWLGVGALVLATVVIGAGNYWVPADRDSETKYQRLDSQEPE